MANYIAILLAISLNSPFCGTQGNNVIESQTMASEPREIIAQNLTEVGYSGLFLSGESSLSQCFWQNGRNRIYLEQIVQSNKYSDLARILASEILYAKSPNYPSPEFEETLAYLYSQALALTGSETGGSKFSGNMWGVMYYSDTKSIGDYGVFSGRLLARGKRVIPYLIKLLDNSDRIFYEGSREATKGNSLKYRVKDAAAYYIGKITEIPVKFYEQPKDRDAEIERLKEALKKNNWDE